MRMHEGALAVKGPRAAGPGLLAQGNRTGNEGFGWGCVVVGGAGGMERVGGAGSGPPDMACHDSRSPNVCMLTWLFNYSTDSPSVGNWD